MKNLKFINTRFDPDITPIHDIAKSMAEAFGYTAELGEIDAKLAQLIRLRVAQLNNCAYCLILHSQACRDLDIETAKIDGLGSWWESELYDEAEQAALAYCDALTKCDQPGFHKYHSVVSRFFAESGIAELAAIIINMNVWTRLKLAQGATPTFEK